MSLTNPCKLTKGQLSGFYFSVLYGIKPKEQGAFLRDELVKFAVERFGVGTDDRNRRSRILAESERFITRSEMATRFGVDRRFANRILSAGSIATIRVQGGPKRAKLLVDTSSVAIPRTSTGKVLNAREAAALIGIPRAVLILLKELGLFQARHLPPGIRGFDERDVETYKERLVNSESLPRGVIGEAKMVRLGDFLAGARGDALSKAMVISEIHSGRMVVAGATAKYVQDLWISRDALNLLIAGIGKPNWAVLRRRSPNTVNSEGGISMRQAARELACNRATVRALVENGVLQRSSGNGCAMWVSGASVDTFRAEYQSVGSIARTAHTTRRLLITICEKINIALLHTGSGGETYQPFIQTKDVPNVLSARWSFPVRDRHTRLRWKRLAEQGTMDQTRVPNI